MENSLGGTAETQTPGFNKDSAIIFKGIEKIFCTSINYSLASLQR